MVARWAEENFDLLAIGASAKESTVYNVFAPNMLIKRQLSGLSFVIHNRSIKNVLVARTI